MDIFACETQNMREKAWNVLLFKHLSMLIHAQDLVYTLKELMPTQYQKDNLEAMLALFLEAQGHPLPEHSQTKSPSAISRFLNINSWSTRKMIRAVRSSALQTVLKALLSFSKGRKPFLQVIIDLTTLEKRGKFKFFEDLIRVYNCFAWSTSSSSLFSNRKMADSLEFSGLERKRDSISCTTWAETG